MSSLRVACTDATLLRGGEASAVIHPVLRIPYDCGEQQGEYRRLQDSALQAELAPGRAGPGKRITDPFHQALVQDVQWEVTRSHDFGRTEHINIQEAGRLLRNSRAEARPSS